MFGIRSEGGIDLRDVYRITAVVAVALLGATLLAGTAVAHDDGGGPTGNGDGLTVHNQTKPLDQHGEIHTLHVDEATADTDFYVDLHTDNGTINTTRTFEAGTVKQSFDVTLDPTITSDTEVDVAIHAANGTELVNETITVDVVEAPSVSVADQTHQLDEHDEIHTLTVATAAANQEYYVDLHTDDGTINTTRTFDAGTAQSDLTVSLDPTITSTTNVTAAVHATNGTELAAETATVTTADVDFSNQTRELDEHDEVHSIVVETASAGTSYYVDVHTANGTINTTRTFDAGTTNENLSLVLDPTLKSDTEVTVAVHDTDGTELAAQTATVDVTEGSQGQMENDTETDTSMATETATNTDTSMGTETTNGDGEEATTETGDETTETSDETTEASDTTTEASDTTTESSSGSGPGFGVLGAVVALAGAALLARSRN